MWRGIEIQVVVDVIPGFQRTLSGQSFISQLVTWFRQFRQLGNHTSPESLKFQAACSLSDIICCV